MDLNINLDFTTADHDVEQIAGIIQAAVVAALDANGIEPPHVNVTPSSPPRVLISVKGGIADVAAVDGRAVITIADFDTNDATLSGEEHLGDDTGFALAIGEAEKRLGIEHDPDSGPRFGRQRQF